MKSATENKDQRPWCFGTLDIVFPQQSNGLRSTPETCFACAHKTDCLKSALETPEGLKVREEVADRSYGAGMISFLQRWSRKKEIQRKRQQKKKTQI